MTIRKRGKGARIVKADKDHRWQVTCSCGTYRLSLHATPLAARVARDAHLAMVTLPTEEPGPL